MKKLAIITIWEDGDWDVEKIKITPKDLVSHLKEIVSHFSQKKN